MLRFRMRACLGVLIALACTLTFASAQAQTVTAIIPVGNVPAAVAVDPGSHTVYVANEGGNSASVINGSTNTVTATIPVGSVPKGVALDPGSHTVYVANYFANNVSVINGGTNTVTATIPVGHGPFGVAVDPGSHTVYVTIVGDNTVSVINGATNTVTATVPVGIAPYAVAVDAGSHTVYVANAGSRTVSVINGSTNTVSATIPVGNNPYGLGVDPGSHTVYVANLVGNSVSVINGSTNTVTATVPVGNGPDGVAVDPGSQTIYVANYYDNNVSVINGSTNTVTTAIPVGHAPYGVAVDPTTHTAYVANSGDNTVSVITALPVASPYNPITPARILDTRPTSPVGPYNTPFGSAVARPVTVTGLGGVPSQGVSAVVLNVTVTDTSTSSYLTVYPSCAGSPPNASNLNWTAGVTIPNLVTATVGSDGKVCMYNAAGSTDVVVDVEGWYGVGGNVAPAGTYHALAPSRVLDTRPGSQVGPYNTPFGANVPRSVQVTGLGGVPTTGVSAVVLNVTVTDTSTSSYLTVYPSCAQSAPTASNLNWVTGKTIANRVIIPVGSGGNICMNNAYGTTDVVVDVAGWFGDASSALGSQELPLAAPCRVLDTRAGSQIGPYNTPFGAGVSRTVTLDGACGVPSSGVTAVVLNVTATNTSQSSYFTVYPSGNPPTASDLNWVGGVTIPNLVIASVNASGQINIFNAWGTVDGVVDVVGYFQ